MVKFRYQQGSVLKHVVAHALDSLVAAFGEEVILGLVSRKTWNGWIHKESCARSVAGVLLFI